MNIDAKIRNLKPSQSVRLSGDAECWVMAERSGNGKTLRFVRFTKSTQVVFHTVSF